MPSMSTIESLFCRSAPWEAATRRWVLPWALQGVRPTGRVLEIGGGGGAMAAQLLAASTPADRLQLTVTDFDPVMVGAAQDRLQRFGGRAHAEVADATALPFGDGEFDTVVSFIMLHHVVAWEQALREAVRVLRPGGTLVGYDLLGTAPARILHRLEGAPHRFIDRGQLRPHLAGLPLRDLTVRENVALTRFRATRTAGR
ncbi:class I SAM-dependent methyltransferase [Tsukamurella strandjordii]|uniref:Class I SAM-dependent methyltransferase n=1 Tax=Tsukamurella strandjordii TaxID=147577 RepID=A0AA90NEK7_9ACTN|nr:class I SAM-dependent methyltransferase [Tsukamurella strandjordii]MDP0400533.1 class I SAM-dependent methyltransferase [Tsukamurella strandjordii]